MGSEGREGDAWRALSLLSPSWGCAGLWRTLAKLSLAVEAPSQVLRPTGGLAGLQSRITALALWEMGICEGCWGEGAGKQGGFALLGTGFGAVLLMRNGENFIYLDPGMFPSTVVFLSRQRQPQE